jgi:NTE family protein
LPQLCHAGSTTDPASASLPHSARRPDTPHREKRAPTHNLGVALGGGAARGLAHIVVLEALDELGIRPAVIAGTSIGAILGAVYAAGMPGAEMRDFAIQLFGNRTEMIKRIAKRWPGALSALWNPFTPAMFNGETLIEILLPEIVPLEFSGLQIPLIVVATDFYAEEQVLFESGPLVPAISASAALPALLKPVQIGDRILIDGGFVNPTPFDILKDRVDLVLAVDVTASITRNPKRSMPTSTETLLGAAQITLRSIVRQKLAVQAPDILIRPDIGNFGGLDFASIEEILKAAEPTRDIVKRQIEAKLDSVRTA